MKAGLTFVLIAFIAAGLLGTTRLLTAPRIAANQAALAAAVRAELLGATQTNAQTNAVTVLCAVQTRGYAGVIELLIGLDDTQSLVGVRVTRHSETPGIGEFIERQRSAWITGFSGLSFGQRFYAKPAAERLRLLEGELDAVSGASVTRRALLRGVAAGCPA